MSLVICNYTVVVINALTCASNKHIHTPSHSLLHDTHSYTPPRICKLISIPIDPNSYILNIDVTLDYCRWQRTHTLTTETKHTQQTSALKIAHHNNAPQKNILSHAQSVESAASVSIQASSSQRELVADSEERGNAWDVARRQRAQTVSFFHILVVPAV